MKYNVIIIDEKELEQLKQIVSRAQNSKDEIFKTSVQKLYEELKSAKILKSDQVPDDVVRFNSVVTIKTPFANAMKYQIVTPEKSDISQNKLSILSPMGLALLGYAVDDEVLWQFPSGMNTIKILKVEQNNSVKEDI